MPGIPQIWYLDLFVGANDYKAVESAGAGSHKEINRTTLTLDDIENGLKQSIVTNQLKLIKLRNTFPAFNGKIHITPTKKHRLDIKWIYIDNFANLIADLKTFAFTIKYSKGDKDDIITFQ